MPSWNISEQHTVLKFVCLIYRVTIRAIFTGRTLARISILPKISRFWLFALCRSIIVWHYFRRAEQTAPYAFKSLSQYIGVIQWSVRSFKSNEQTNTCTYLHCFNHSPSHAPRLVNYIQYLHVICQTTLDVLGNIKSWPGCVPYK